MRGLTGFSPIARALIVMAAIAIVVTFIRSAAAIITPILLAVFITIVATPPLRWMGRHGVPKWFALILVTLILLDLGSFFLLFITGALEGFRDNLPGYQDRFVLLSDQLGGWLESVGIAGSKEAVPDILNLAQVSALIRATLSNVSAIFATGLLILLAVIFMLLEVATFPAKLEAAFHLTEEVRDRLQRVLNAVNRYMVIKSLTSLATALCVWLWLWFLDLDFAALWAMLAFFLNFIPFVGVLLMTIPAALFALVQTDLQITLLVVLGYLMINTVIGSILEPRIMGHGLGISTLAVFLSLLFWGWVIGTVGVFLAVPLTMALMIALEASPQTRSLAILLGPKVVQEPESDAATSSDGISTDEESGSA